MSSMDINEIMKYLPHRYPFLLLDKVTSVDPGKKITAVKNVSINEPFFQGHFPSRPVFPGVLILEAMAQAAAVLSLKAESTMPDADSLYYFVGIDGARFKKPVGPGDQLVLEVELTRSMRGIWKYAGKALVDGAVVAEAELMCTVRKAT